MKNILLLLLTCSFAFSQTQEQLVQYIPAGKQMALEAYVAQGGGMISKGGSSNPAFRYQAGPIKGLTKEQAVQKFEVMWAKVGGDTKLKYAKRAFESGRDPDVNRQLAGEQSSGASDAEDQNARLIEESKARRLQQEQERKMREMQEKIRRLEGQ